MFSFKGGEYLPGDSYELERPLRVPPTLLGEGQICTAMFRLDNEWGFAIPVKFVDPPLRHPSGVHVGGIVNEHESLRSCGNGIIPVRLYKGGEWDHPKLQIHGKLAIEAYFLERPGEMDQELAQILEAARSIPFAA